MELVKLWESDIRKAYEVYSSFEENENGFMNDAYGLTFDEFKEFVSKKEKNSKGINLKEGHVPDTVYILKNEDNYVGIFKFRHYLNDFLKAGAGHIGYGISPKYRNLGYATEGLRLMVKLAKEIVLEDEIYMSVHKNNPASLKAQMKNGAYIHHENEEEYFTRIKKDKKEIAKSKFLNGYNCAQAVICTYASDVNLDEETAFRISEGFGSGINGLENVCGACSGLIMALSLQLSRKDLKSPTRPTTYKKVKEVVKEFESRMGSCECKVLKQTKDSTLVHGKRKGCLDCVMCACDIYEENYGKK